MSFLIVVLLILVVLAIVFAAIYNKLVKNKNHMHEGWSGMDVCLKKRYDLIPNLVETVKGYANHEKGTLEEITRYRSEAMRAGSQSDRMQSENSLGKALANLLVVAENYPDLKANSNFQQLQQQLTMLENDLEMSRRYYNGTVRENNIYIESFPSNLIAGIFNFQKGDFFVTEQSERALPRVSF